MNHSTVTIAPTTSVNQPYALKLGTKLLVTVTIENSIVEGGDYQLTGGQLPSDCYTLGTPAVSADQDHHVQIEVVIHPTQETDLGQHQLQLQLVTSNGEILWESSLYLQFLAADDIEIMLTPNLTVVEDEVGLYEVEITNTSQEERVLAMQPIGLPTRNGCVFTSDPSELTLGPNQTGKTELMVQPQRWWFRPWFGKGREYHFQVDLQDHDGIPLPQQLAQGTLLWKPYPHAHSLKLLWLLILGLGTSSALIGYLLLRKPTTPAIATLNSSQTAAPQTGQQDIQLSWTIENSQKLSKVVLLRESNGQSTVAQTLWFNNGIPSQLQRKQASQNTNFCQTQSDVLECSGITTDTKTAGNYTFKLQAFAKGGAEQPADSKTTQSLAFRPKAVPQITQFYAPTHKGDASASTKGPLAAAAQSDTIKLNWDIENPDQLTELQVMTVDANNAEDGILQRFNFQDGKLPDTLKKFCKFTPKLACQNVPTAANRPGGYYFKLIATYQQDQQPFTVSKTIGPMQQQSEKLRIANFLINGKQAPAQYVLKPGEKDLKLSWEVEGGQKPTVAILPKPGVIPSTGSMQVQLDPKQSSLFVLQAIDTDGKQVTQEVVIAGNSANQQPTSSGSSQVADAQSNPKVSIQSDPAALAAELSPTAPQPAVLRENPIFPPNPAPSPKPASPPKPAPVSKPQIKQSPAPAKKPVAKPPAQSPPSNPKVAFSKPSPEYSATNWEEAKNVTKGLVIARQKGKIVLNGLTWNKTQDAITLMRRGYSRKEAAQRAGVPLWKLDVLVSLGQSK